MNLYVYCGNNPITWVDSYGLAKDDIEKRIRQLEEYIKSAEAAAVTNIETLKILHKDKKFWEDYYDVVQYIDAGFTFATAIPAAVRVATGTGAMLASKQAIKGKPLMGKGIDLTRRYAGERLALKELDKFIDSKVMGAISGAILTTRINAARRKKMGSYDPYIQDVLDNIGSLSKGVKEARQELRILGYDY